MLSGLTNIPGLFSIFTHAGKGEALLFDNKLLIEAGWSTEQVLFLIEKTFKVEYWGLLEFADSWSVYVEKKHCQRVVKSLLLSGIPVNILPGDIPDRPVGDVGSDQESWLVKLIKKASAL